MFQRQSVALQLLKGFRLQRLLISYDMRNFNAKRLEILGFETQFSPSRRSWTLALKLEKKAAINAALAIEHLLIAHLGRILTTKVFWRRVANDTYYTDVNEIAKSESLLSSSEDSHAKISTQ